MIGGMEDLAYLQRPAALAGIEEATRLRGFLMASEPLTGALLRTLAASKPGGRFLELGTGTGIATAWLLDGMDAGSALVSVDVDGDVQGVAREHLGGDLRLTLQTEDAIAYLVRQPARSFDLVFADAIPGKYDRPELALELVREGGFFVIDDMLPQPNWPEGHAAKVSALLAWLAAQPAIAIAPMAWATGIVIAARAAVPRR
jgi:predicted O-methyltransferase YrrM